MPSRARPLLGAMARALFCAGVICDFINFGGAACVMNDVVIFGVRRCAGIVYARERLLAVAQLVSGHIFEGNGKEYIFF